MRIAITGATGLLGRNLLFEILKQNLSKLEDLEILILGRDKESTSLHERLKEIILQDGIYYIGLNDKDLNIIRQIEKIILPIHFDLTKDHLNISPNDFSLLIKRPIDFFFHIAAFTDFRSSPKIKALLQEINVNGTRRILNLIKSLNVKEIIYVGSAYSCGDATGQISPDYTNINGSFRNPYEESKLIAELDFKEVASKHKYRYRIFRPIGICGRLIEKPIGAICKYDIFYGWAAFFLKQKIRILKSLKGIYDKSLHMPIRIRLNQKSGLNIVPSDYAAKIMYAACINNDQGLCYHLVNDVDIPHKIYAKIILDTLNINGYIFVESEPKNMNKLESLYYKTVGMIFTPYAIFDTLSFDTTNLKDLQHITGLKCPSMDAHNFMNLIDYSKNHYFGLSESGHKIASEG